jgi:hypothetical protein
MDRAARCIDGARGQAMPRAGAMVFAAGRSAPATGTEGMVGKITANPLLVGQSIIDCSYFG